MKIQKLNSGLLAIILLFVMAAFFLSGCESSSSSDENTGTLQFSAMTASPSSVDVGSNAVIVATLSNGTTPLPNREVVFAVSSTYGSCTPLIDTTDANGEAGTVFAATQAGSAVITATSGTLVRSATVVINTPGGDTTTTGSGNIHTVATPSIITANGTDSSLITVTVMNGAGDLAPDGTLIKFVAGEKFDDIDDNGYFTIGVDTVIYDINNNGMWDPVGTIIDTASVSGGNGQARAYYYAGTSAQTVYVKATVGVDGFAGYGEIGIQLNATADIHSIFIATSEIHMAVKQTGGMETAFLYATGYDANGNAVPQGIPISFIITDGPDTTINGEHLGNLSGDQKRGPYVAYTNSIGIASCPITSGTIPGTIRIRAFVGPVLSNSTQIMVHAGPPARISVASEKFNVDNWGWVNREVGISALVSDAWNNPVADSVVVYFTTDEGVIKAHEARTMYEIGHASSVWFSWGPDTGSDGVVWIYAETSGGTIVDSAFFLNSWIPDTLYYITFPDNMYANNYANEFIYVAVRDLNRNFVVSEYLAEIKFDAELVEFTDRENGDGNFSSGVGIKANSKILDQDFSLTGGNDDGIGAVEFITARWGAGAFVTAPCTLLTDNAYRDNCELSVENTTPDYGETVYFSVKIGDLSGNPLGDHTVVASSTAGTIPVNTLETNSYGLAEFYTIIMPDASSGATKVTLTVQDIDPMGGITLQEQLTIPANPILSVLPAALDFGSATNSLNLTVSNSGYGGSVTWTAADDKPWVTLGASSGTVTTNTDVVSVTVDRSGLPAGDYSATITVNSDNGTATVAITMTVL